MDLKYLSTKDVVCFDVREVPPPKNTRIYLVSKWGVGRIGLYEEDFDIAWYPLPSLPASVRDE